jgi:phosphoenolpyruvate---glycerone phosphotransferase subunit DhaL
LVNQKEILIGVIGSISKKLIDAEKVLTDLDSPAGDADCGSGVKRGFEAVLGVMPELEPMQPGDILKKVGFTLAYTIGGTSGAMLGTGFIETGKSIGENVNPEIGDWIKALDSALSVIKRRGGNTQVGDKTMVDALEPAIESMKVFLRNGSNVSDGRQEIIPVIEAALNSARDGSERTIDLVARKGRASYLGERSRGHRDPGSLVIALMFEAALDYLKKI